MHGLVCGFVLGVALAFLLSQFAPDIDIVWLGRRNHTPRLVQHTTGQPQPQATQPQTQKRQSQSHYVTDTDTQLISALALKHTLHAVISAKRKREGIAVPHVSWYDDHNSKASNAATKSDSPCPMSMTVSIQTPYLCLFGHVVAVVSLGGDVVFSADVLTTVWQNVGGIVLVQTLEKSELVPEIGELSNLQFIFLESAVYGQVPVELYLLTNLKLLTIKSPVTGSLSPLVSRLKSLTSLVISGTEISGSIPESLFQMTALAYLDISYNDISGTLSPTIGNLTSVVFVRLASNGFWDPLPTQIASLVKLRHLEIVYNYFDGTIPTQLGTLEQLTYLDLGYNEFVGSMPTQLGLLTLLTSLALTSNHLSGTLPYQLTHLVLLTNLELSENQFHGSLPLSLLLLGIACDSTHIESPTCNTVCPGCVISSFEVHTCGGEAYQPQCIPGYYFIPVIVFVVFFFALALRPISPPNTPRKQFIIEVMVATLSVIDMAMDILFVIKSHKFQMHVSSIAILVLVTCVNFGVCVWVFSQTAQEINVDGSHSKLHFREHVYKRKFKLTLTAVYCSVNLRGLPYIVNKAGESHESIQFGQLGLRSLVGLATVMLEDIPQFILQVESVVSHDKTLIVVLSLTATIISILIECEKIFFDRILRQSTATTVFTSIPTTTTTTTAATIASRMRRMSYAVTQMFAFAPTPIAPTPTTTAAAPTSTQETLTPVATTPASSPTQSHQQQQLQLQQQASEGDTESAVGRVSGELAQEIFLASPRAGHEFELTQLTSSHS